MPRQPRLDAPGTLHHVMIRGIDGTKIFRDNEDRKDFLSRISRLVGKPGARSIAWALLTNHVHLLLFSGHQGISFFIRSLLTAREFGITMAEVARQVGISSSAISKAIRLLDARNKKS